MKYANSPCFPPLVSRAIRTCLAGLVAALCVYFGGIKSAHAVPSFARKYKTSCVTCHTVFPKLNPFGEAFRRNGFRFPSKDGSVDSDNVQAETLALGQDEYKKLFPNSVWPDSITQAVPLSVLVMAGAPINLPNTEAHDMAQNTFAWNEFVGEAAIFAAGSFTDTLTYFFELSIADGGIEAEHAFLEWSDIVGPRHAVNLMVGKFMPTLTSFGGHSSYVFDHPMLPGESIGMLYNDSAAEDPLTMAFGHPIGLELNGVLAHYFDYSLGWMASGVAEEMDFTTPNSQDAYAHIGVKLCGMTLDGEGRCGAQIADPKKPWAETSVTLDAFGYHGLRRINANTDPAGPNPKDDKFNTIGGDVNIQLGSLGLISGVEYEHHSDPYAGDPGDPAAVPPVPPTDVTDSADAIMQFNELSYVVFPWLVPAVRTEYTRINTNQGGHPSLLRVMPTVAMLINPNLKVNVQGDIEHTSGATTPSGNWGGAGGTLAPGQNKTEAEKILLNAAWAF
jgi:hypothetical protein